MKYNKIIFLFTCISILFISCGKKSNLGKMIPKEAAVIIDINTKSFFSKLSWNEIKMTGWFTQHLSDSSTPSAVKPYMEDPSKTGIDMNADIVFFTVNPDNNGHAFVEGTIKDSKAFSDFLTTTHPGGSITKDGDLTIYKSSKGVISWNNEKFVFVSHSFNSHWDKNVNDSTKNMVPADTASDDMGKICKDIFSLSKDKSLYDNEKFAKLTEEAGEFHCWININELSRNTMKNLPGMFGMVKLDKFLEDNISTATINFQDGKITGTHKQYFGKELTDILKKGEGNINTDMIKRLPTQNLSAVMSLHFTPGSLLEIIKLTGLDGFINLFMAQKGISLDDALKATKGDIVFSMSDLTIKKDSLWRDTITDKHKNRVNMNLQPNGTFLFAISINDKEAFNKLFDITKEMGNGMKEKGVISKTDDKYFVASNSQDAVNNYLSGTPSNPDFLSKIKDHPMGGFIDLQQILKSLQTDFTKDSAAKFYYDRNISMWNNLYFTGGEYKDGGLISNGEVNLIDKKTNSLPQLNQYLDDLSKVMMAEKKKRKEMVMDRSITDTTSAPTKKLVHK